MADPKSFFPSFARGSAAARIALLLCCGALAAAFDLSGLSGAIELKTVDLRFRARERLSALFGPLDTAPKDIIVVAIDDKTEQSIEEPMILWDRYFAQVLRAAADAGARVIAVDFVWAKPIERFLPAADPANSHALRKALLYLKRRGAGPVMAAAATGLPPLREHVAAAGPENFALVNTTPDRDKSIRRQKLLFNFSNRPSPSFALLAAMRFTRRDLGAFPAEVYVDYRSARPPFDVIPFHEALAKARGGDAAALSRAFKDKLVLLGTVSSIEDLQCTPVDRELPGLLVHAYTIATLLKGKYLEEWGHWSRIAAVMALVFLAGTCCFLLEPVAGTALSLALAALYALLCFWLFLLGRIAALAAPLAGIALTAGAVYAYRLMIEERERRRTVATLRRYVSDAVADEILKSPEHLTLKGRRMQVAVMFADIRGFTTFSEKEDPEYVVGRLNEYLSAMTEVIQGKRGTLDKFIGDGLMAYFGAPLPDPEASRRAVEAGLAMLRKVEELNRQWSSDGRFTLRIGVGINCGPAIVGNIGSERKTDYGPLGDTVNVASRVEGLTKQFSKDLIVTETVFKDIEPWFDAEPLGETPIKGHTPVRVYAVKGPLLTVSDGLEGVNNNG